MKPEKSNLNIQSKEDLFSNFIEKELKISDYKLNFFNVGKDNITGECSYDGNKIIIQLLGDITESQIKIIDKTLKICANEGFTVADKAFEKRFFNYKGDTFQVMKKLDGENKSYKELSFEVLEETMKYIANFHNTIEKYDFSEFKKGTNKYKNLYNFIGLSYEQVKLNDNYEEKFNELMELAGTLKISTGLRRGCIHGDICTKNILFKENKIAGLIDYEMITVDDFLFDLVDHFRNYMKEENFGKEEFFKLLKAYEEIRPLNKSEKNSLDNYLKTIILNTGFRYFLALFEGSGFKNNTTAMGTSYEKIDRCIMEYKKAESFFS